MKYQQLKRRGEKNASLRLRLRLRTQPPSPTRREEIGWCRSLPCVMESSSSKPETMLTTTIRWATEVDFSSATGCVVASSWFCEYVGVSDQLDRCRGGEVSLGVTEERCMPPPLKKYGLIRGGRPHGLYGDENISVGCWGTVSGSR